MTDTPLQPLRDAIVAAIHGRDGALPQDARATLFDYASARPDASLPEAPLRAFADKTLGNAYKIVDRDVQALLGAGYSEDAVFEIITTLAAGSGMRRIELGLAALRGEVAAKAGA